MIAAVDFVYTFFELPFMRKLLVTCNDFPFSVSAITAISTVLQPPVLFPLFKE